MATFNCARGAAVADPSPWHAFLQGIQRLTGADQLRLTSGNPKAARILGQAGTVSAKGVQELEAAADLAWTRKTVVVVPDTLRPMAGASGSDRPAEDRGKRAIPDGRAWFRSLAAIPLTDDRRSVGVLAIGWNEPARDLSTILQALGEVTPLAAMALQASSQDPAEPSAELAALAGLSEVGRRLNQRMAMEAVLEVVLNTAMSISDAPAAAIWLRNREGVWHLRLCRGLGELERDHLLSLVKCLPADAVSGLSWPSSPHLFHVLAATDEVLGCLLVSRQTPFTPFEQSLLRMLSQQATTAILYHQAAYYDTLTGLPNQAYLTRWITRHVRETPSMPLSLWRLALNQFKRVDEADGSEVADAVLVELANRLRQMIPDRGFLARAASDEFHLVLSGTNDVKSLEDLALRVMQAVRQPFPVRQHEIILTASLGMARYPADAATAEQLQQRANLALRVAQHRGYDVHAFYETGMTEHAGTRIALETRLRRAIADGRLHLNYQPQIDGDTGLMVGVEALARWTDASGKAIPPGVFIPLAESTGQIVALGDWVLRESARQVLAWKRQGFRSPRVSVNVSAVQLQRPDFTDRLQALLADVGCAPSAMELEITESAGLHHPDQTLRILLELQALGFRVAIDDFGTGWSSLNYLLDYPVDTLKIDQSFVSRVMQEPKAQAVVRTIVKLAEALGVEVVAEGVETREEAMFLKTLGCRLWQGFWLARPLSAEQIDWNRRWVSETCSEPR